MLTLIKTTGINVTTAVALLVAPMVLVAGFFMTSSVSAAGVEVTVSPTDFTAAAGGEVTISFTSTAEFAATDEISVSFSPALSAAVTACATATTDADGNSTPDGAFGSYSTTGATYTFTGVTSAASTTGVDLCLTVPATTQASYSISIVTANDFGAALIYVENDNDVTVTAEVVPTLSFNIRTLADDADTNVCDLETVNTTTLPNKDNTDNGTGECGYSLAVGTNAAGGFQVAVIADGPLNNASASIANYADGTTAAPVTLAAGTEGYGFVNITPATTGRNTVSGLYDTAITVDTQAGFTFNEDVTPVPTTTQNFVSYTDGIQYTAGVDATDVTQVMHGITVGAGTPAGVYDQVVTYTVTANF